jgi:copper chaperone CopZ
MKNTHMMTLRENCRKASNPQIAAGIKLALPSNFLWNQIFSGIKLALPSNFNFLFLLMIFTAGGAQAQEKEQKFQTVVIQTSAECGDCKDRIEEALNYTKGVVFAELDLATKKVTVKFLTKKISLQKVKEAIAAIGYDADEVKAVPEAQRNLPKCCQPNGMKNL